MAQQTSPRVGAARTIAASLLALLTLVSGLLAGPVAAQESGPRAASDGTRRIPKPVLAPALRDVLRGGLGIAAADARAGRPAALPGMITRERAGRREVAVTVDVRAGSIERVAAGLRRERATITSASSRSVEGYLPVAGLTAAAALDGVRSISPIYPRRHGAFVTPAIQSSGAPDWHAAGFDGTGIKVGILDGGFEGIAALLGVEIPKNVIARCYTEVGVYSTEIDDCENGVDHGTAVAELVVDMAPGAQLYLADPESPHDYREAIRWMTSEGVRIINSSASSGYLFDGPGDGTAGRVDSSYEEIDLAVSLGALWVNSAGNEGDTGWIGDWADADGDDTLDWAAGDEGNTIHLEAGQQIRVAMRWPDEWGASANDYDIALFDGDVALAVGSDFQTGDGDPYEVFDFAAGAAGDYDLVIRRYDAEPAIGLQVLIYSSGPLTLEYSVAATTLPSPADSASPGMVSVGAVKADEVDVIEPYSSRGPTVDGRIKPDLVAPDCMATITFGHFCGTSASAPMVAGAAALALQADPTMGAPEVADYLRDAAAPLGDPSPNSTYGHGRLRLGEPVAVKPTGRSLGLRASTRSLTWPAELTLTATLTPPIPAGRIVYFQASADGTTWTSVGSAVAEDGATAELTFAPTASRSYRAMALGTAVTSGSVEVAIHQRLSVRPSLAVAPAGRPVRVIRAGTIVSFDAVVRPARGDQPRPVVEYVVFQRIGPAWVLDRRVDVTADRTGVAHVPLRFDVPGQWYVRARALATRSAAVSTWSQTFRYDVTGTSTGALERLWRADLSGGSATLSSYSNGTSVLALSVAGFGSSQPVVVGVQRACGPVPRVTTLRSVRTSAGGALGSSITLSATQAAAIARASADGATLSLVLRSGSDTRCAPLVPRPLVVASIATGEEAAAVATDGNGVWVANIFEDTVSRIDPATNVVTATIPVPGYPYGVASDGTTVWVTHVAGGALTRIDVATNEVLDTAPIGELAGNITFGGGAVWVVIQGEDEVVKVDVRSGEVIARIGVASDPSGIAYADGTVWVTSPADGIVTRIDAGTDEIVAEIEVPGVNNVAARDGEVWVSVRPARAASGAIVRIDPQTDSVAERIAVGFEPAGLAIAGDSVYVAMGGEPTLVQVRDGRVAARIPVAMKSLAVAVGFRSLWLLHPYGAGIAGSGLFAGGVTRINI